MPKIQVDSPVRNISVDGGKTIRSYGEGVHDVSDAESKALIKAGGRLVKELSANTEGGRGSRSLIDLKPLRADAVREHWLAEKIAVFKIAESARKANKASKKTSKGKNSK